MPLVQNHTLFPYYAPFMPAAIKHKVLRDMLGKGNALHMRSGLMASKVHAIQKLRYCPKCVEEDRSTYGEAFWHTSHQIQGILFCSTHKILLEESEIIVRQGESRFKYISADPVIGINAPLRTTSNLPQSSTLLSIAEDATWLLENYMETLCLELIMDQYRRIYSEIDRTSFKPMRLVRNFCDLYGESTLRVLGCEIDEQVIDNWLVRLIRGKLITHNPIRNLLFILAT
jgi:hypothetical protein